MALAVIAVCGVCVALVLAAVHGRQGIVLLLLLVLATLYLPFLAARARRLWLLSVPLLVFWLPAPLGFFAFAPLKDLSTVEALIAAALCLVAAKYLATKDAVPLSKLKSFPWLGFMLLLGGAIVTYVVVPHTGQELPYIRTILILPAALGLLTLLLVDDTKAALTLLWAVVASAGLLGIVFLLGSKGFGPFSPAEYAMGTGRASVAFNLPILGSLVIDPQSAGDKFDMGFSIAWFLLLISPGGRQRLAALVLAGIFAAVVVSAQGRAGLAACVLAIAVFGIWALGEVPSTRRIAVPATLTGLASTVGIALYIALSSKSDSYAARILVLFSSPSSDGNFISRTESWGLGSSIAASHPLGIGLFGPPYGVGTSTWATHNLWLFVALSFGWVGVSGLVLVFLKFGRVFVTALRSGGADSSKFAILGLVLLMNVLLTGFFAPLVWSPFSAVLIWVPLWIAFAGVLRSSGLRASPGGSGRL